MPIRRHLAPAFVAGAIFSLITLQIVPAMASTVQPAVLGEVQVTATRISEPIESLPASVTVVYGDELRARGATDLRTALALVPGVDFPPGGDAGPASSVPSLWGLHEFDAFLLVVDGVPWGGTFNPALAAVDLADVERIEVLKGAAPVMYGATSFVGVIQVIRYPAGESTGDARLSAMSRSGGSAEFSSPLPKLGDYGQSIVLDGEHNRLIGRDQGLDREHLLYRGGAPLANGAVTVDAEYTAQTQLPPSPVIRTGTGLTTLTPLNANFNPADAGIDEHRSRLTLSYSEPTRFGNWHTLISYTRSTVHDVRGFVRPELAIGADGNNSDGFNQERTIDDGYFDTGLATELSPTLSLTSGLDWLYGHGTQASGNFAYVAVLDGSVIPPPSGARHIDEVNGLDNRRNFAGVYTQARWQATDRLLVTSGFRLNRTTERQLSTHGDTIDSTNNLTALDSQTNTRGSSSLGTSFRLWGAEGGGERGTLYVDYRNTFKPAAIDFGPDLTPTILKPETAESWEAGLRGASLTGRLEWEVALFNLDFRNLVVHQTTPDGRRLLANAGSERFQGAEGELRWRVASTTTVTASYAYHDTRFGNTVAVESGNTVQLDGHQLNLSPHGLAALGFVFAPAQGVEAAAQYAYVGRRFLDRLNTAPVGGYATLDAHLAYRFARYRVALDAYNLTDRRDPVTASEFGDQSYYLLPARLLRLSVDYRL
jgi:iron complex outermembrane recepter protein